MKKVTVDFSKTVGPVKPMHAVNNGPVRSVRGTGNFDAFVDAGIPYMRNHDAAFLDSYGGPHTVDVLNIFTDFDADENDPASYDFTLTDRYCQTCTDTGGEVFYRLGSRIEHAVKKYQTKPPKDYAKYARICEHIIRHLCYGWADGLHLPITYWEIWNEPDCGSEKEGYDWRKGDNPCWQGPHEEFLKFYEVMAKHLKGCFPELKIGGPAYTACKEGKKEPVEFAEYMRDHHVPLDFFSFHRYHTDPKELAANCEYTRRLMDRYGFTDTETVLNEWNYVISFHGEEMNISYDVMKNEKGAAFAAACMLAAQKTPLDMLMYYDFRPCMYSGPFESGTYRLRKPYWPFWYFNKLYRLGQEVESGNDEDVYVCAAKGDAGAAVEVAYYRNEEPEEEEIEIYMKGLSGRTRFVTYLTDKDHDNAKIRTDVFTGEEGSIILSVKPSSVICIFTEQ